MKRSLATLTLIIALSFPVLAGHTQPDNRPCVDGTPGCISDLRTEDSADNELLSDETTPSDDLGYKTLLLLTAIGLWLRFRA